VQAGKGEGYSHGFDQTFGPSVYAASLILDDLPTISEGRVQQITTRAVNLGEFGGKYQ
jgi:hypothetical protein